MFSAVPCVARDFNRSVDLDELKGNRACIKKDFQLGQSMITSEARA
jgi:hypothetical protein